MIGLKKLWTRVKQKWEDLDYSIKERVVEILHSVLTYLFNSVLLSVPVSLYFNFQGYPFFKIYFYSMVSFWIILPFVEHYYVWFREKWKEEVKP